MNRSLNRIFFFVLAMSGIMIQLAAQKRKCGTEAYMKTQTSTAINMDENRRNQENAPPSIPSNTTLSDDVTITIPVVVHIVYKEEVENISEAQIFSQIEVLNKDFRRKNEDATNTPAIFQSVAADVNIEFCLASTDPNGDPTNGITRTHTEQAIFDFDDAIKDSNRGGGDAWDTQSYLNIWVGNLGAFLGYASFPGGNLALDGIVINYTAFGTLGTAAPPFDLGRTTTHEVGHWLNLYHIWGDGGCGLDDGVQDTPLAGASSSNEPPCATPSQNTCHEGAGDLPDMFQNFMDYSHDACMNLFTKGQKTRMRSLFMGNNARASMLASKGCQTVTKLVTNTNVDVKTCSDGIQNGTETGIDCGGDCSPCRADISVPTFSQWGFLIFLLLILNGSLLFLGRLAAIHNSFASSNT